MGVGGDRLRKLQRQSTRKCAPATSAGAQGLAQHDPLRILCLRCALDSSYFSFTA